MIEFVFKLLRSMPLGFLNLFFSSVMLSVYVFLPKRRRMAYENIRLAIGGNYKKTALRTYLYFAKMIALNVKYLGSEEFVKKYVTVKGVENYRYAKSLNRGVIFTTAHFGNWEMMVCASAFLYEPINIMVRPLDAKKVDQLVESVRKSCGNKILSSRLSAFSFIKLLRQNKILGILVDQASGNDSFKIDFFNRKVRVSEGIAVFSYKLGVPILPAYMKEYDGRFEIVIEKPIFAKQSEDFNKEIKSTMEQIYGRFEKWIKNDPEKYFWMHNRWK